MISPVLQIRLDPYLLNELKRRAMRFDISTSRYARYIIESHIFSLPFKNYVS